MATWTTPLPDNGKTPIVEGDPGHPVMHNQIVDAITEIRDNVDAIGTPTVDTLSGATDTGKAVMKAATPAQALTAIGPGAVGAQVFAATTQTNAQTAIGISAARLLAGQTSPAIADPTDAASTQAAVSSIIATLRARGVTL